MSAQAPGSVDNELEDINSVFRRQYANAKARALEHLQRSDIPVIIVQRDVLTLYFRGEMHQLAIASRLATVLKVVAHVPLTVFAILEQSFTVPRRDRSIVIGGAMRQDLGSVKDVASVSLPTLLASPEVSRELSREQVIRLEEIIGATKTFVSAILQRSEIDNKEVWDFLRRLRRQLDACIEEGAAATVDCLEAQVQRWRSEWLRDHWQDVRVVVLGAHMTRKGDLFVQAFRQWMPSPGRVIYGESLETPAAALDLLATHVVDGAFGAALWDRSSAMHSDILAHGAHCRLEAGWSATSSS